MPKVNRRLVFPDRATPYDISHVKEHLMQWMVKVKDVGSFATDCYDTLEAYCESHLEKLSLRERKTLTHCLCKFN